MKPAVKRQLAETTRGLIMSKRENDLIASLYINWRSVKNRKATVQGFRLRLFEKKKNFHLYLVDRAFRGNNGQIYYNYVRLIRARCLSDLLFNFQALILDMD